MKEIPLTLGMVALVDDEDYDRLMKHSWCVVVARSNLYYAKRGITAFGFVTTVLMHHEIMGSTRIDHKNHNGLDNRRENLRPATQQQNLQNRRKRTGTSSRFKGVNPVNNRWRARIVLSEKQFHLGYFSSEEEAARAYDQAAVELFGEFACLNFPGDETK